MNDANKVPLRRGLEFALFAGAILLGFVILDLRMARRIESVASSRRADGSGTIPAKADPHEAIRLGRGEIERGRWQVAQLYLANAITAAPRDVSVLRDCAKAVLDKREWPPRFLDQMDSLLELAAYQVDPSEIPLVLDLRKQLNDARSASEVMGTADVLISDDDLEQSFKRLTTGDPGLWNSPEKLAEHCEGLRDLADRASQSGSSKANELAAKATAELGRWTKIADVARQAAYVDRCLARLSAKDFDLTTNLALSIVQATEAALPAFWGIETESLPDDLRAKLDAYPEVVTGRVEKIGKARSAPILAKIKAVLDEGAPASDYQGRLKFLEVKGEKVRKLAADLRSTSAIDELGERMKAHFEEIGKTKQGQYDAYQRFVLAKLDEFFHTYNKEYTFEPSSTEARRLFGKHGFAEVDQSLLSLETSRLFLDLYGRLAGRMNSIHLVMTEREMVTANKKKLEDF